MAKVKGGVTPIQPPTAEERVEIRSILKEGFTRHEPNQAESIATERSVFAVEDMISEAHYDKGLRFCLGAYNNILDYDAVQTVCAVLTDNELGDATVYFEATGYLSPDIKLLSLYLRRNYDRRNDSVYGEVDKSV